MKPLERVKKYMDEYHPELRFERVTNYYYHWIRVDDNEFLFILDKKLLSSYNYQNHYIIPVDEDFEYYMKKLDK